MQTRPAIVALSFALGSLLEGLAAFELLRPTFFLAHPTALVLLSHGIACGLLTPGFLLLLPPAYRRDRGISILLILGLAAPLPIVGPSLVLLFSRYILKLDRPTKLDSNYFFGDRQYSSGTVESAGNSLTRSLLEHLRNPDVQVRRNAVLAARQLDFQSAIPILRMAQQDNDEHVRIFARSALSQITETLETSLKAMENPKLNPRQKLDRVQFVAEQFRDYVELGLLTEGSRKAHMDKLIGLLSQSLAAEPENEKVLCLLLKFCLLAGDIDRAKTHLRALKKLAPSPEVTLPWELTLCFEDRDWPSLKEMLASIPRSHSQDPQLMRIYEFWRRKGAQTK